MKKVIYFVLALISTSCVNTIKPDLELENSTEIKLKPQLNNILLLSEIADSINIIEFKLNIDEILNTINKIDYDNGFFFCQDRMSGFIYCFDSLGNFKNKIGNRGRGHGEYIYPGAFSINKDNKTVTVIDNNLFIKTYGYNGKFLNSVNLGNNTFIASLYTYNKTMLCYTEKLTNWNGSNNNDYYCNELTVIDSLGIFSRYFDVKKELYPMDNRLTIRSTTPFSDIGNSVTFHHTISNNIYSIDKETTKISKKYNINFGDIAFKQDLAEIPTKELFSVLKDNPESAGLINNVIETEDILHFRYAFNHQVNRAIYYKKSKKIVFGKAENDIFSVPLTVVGGSSNVLWAYIEDKSKIELKDKTFKGIFSHINLKENDNIFLVKIFLKQL